MSPTTKTYTFTLFVQGADVLSDASMDALFEAGCDDATFGARDGAQYGEYHKTRLWNWPDVAHWLTEHDKTKLEIDPEAADLVAALNAAYDLREHTRRLPKGALALIDEALSTSRLAHP